MSWTDFYLVCLIVGFALAVMSLLGGEIHLHLPGHGGGASLGGHHHAGSLGHGAHGHAHAGHGGRGAHASDSGWPAANFSTLMVFLAWFGGAGYVLAGAFRLPEWMVLPGAAVAGVLGAYVVYLFVVRLLLAKDHAMQPHEYALPGMIATVTLGIRAGGTGEISYVQGGTRKSAAARAVEPLAIAIGAEVVVTRFEEGIAYVRRFEVENASGN